MARQELQAWLWRTSLRVWGRQTALDLHSCLPTSATTSAELISSLMFTSATAHHMCAGVAGKHPEKPSIGSSEIGSVLEIWSVVSFI